MKIYSRRIECGKADWERRGRKVNALTLDVRLTEKDGGAWAFSVCGDVWNSRRTDIVSSGQILDEMFRLPMMEPWREVYALWKEYHLNDMTAGSPRQEEAVAEWLAEGNGYDYGKACEMLASKGLLRDEGFVYKGKPYEYGTARPAKPIPAGALAKMKKWVGRGN